MEVLGRILVTGANGHIGQRLVERLGTGAALRAVVRSQRAAETLRPLAAGRDLDVALTDPADADGMARAAEGCGAAVHLVGILKETPTRRYIDAHEGATRALVQAAERARLRKIVTLSILGADVEAHNPCLASKGRAERLLLEGKTPALVLRLPMVLCPGDFATRALRQQGRARLVPLVRGGASLEQPIDVDDVIAAVAAGLENPALEGAIDLAGPESLPRRELLARVARLHGRTPRVLPIPYGVARALAGLLERVSANPPLTRAMLDVLEHDDRVDAAAAARRLGIELTPLDETLRRTVGPEGPG